MSSPTKTSAVGDDDNDAPHNTNNTNTNTMMTNAIATSGGIAATMATMTPAQHQIWQQQQQQMWQQQQMYLWQQQQFAIAEAQKRGEGGHRHHRGGMEPYRVHAQAQHNEGQAWAAAKANGGHPGLISASTPAASPSTGQDGSAVKTTQYIKRGEEGNDGTGLRGTSKTTCEDGDGPRYVYRDFSHLPQDVSVGQMVMSGLTDGSISIGGARKTIGEIRQAKLPAKLEHMLSDPSFASIVGWMPHGRAWKVFQPQEFTERVLPLYFESSNYSSFIRIVNAWGFRRFSTGPDANAYYHELFLRGRPHLLANMKRLPKKARKAPISKEDEPDFYALERRINNEGQVSITGAGFVKGATCTSVGPTSAGLSTGTSSHAQGQDDGDGPAALSPQQQQQEHPPPPPPGLASPWMNPWMQQNNSWVFPQQAATVMGTQQGQALPMTMYAPGAMGMENIDGDSTKESHEEAEDEPTENDDQLDLAASGKKSQEAEV